MAAIIRGKNPIFFFPMFAKDFVMCFRCVYVCGELAREYIPVCMFLCLHSPFLVWQGRCEAGTKSSFNLKVVRDV